MSTVILGDGRTVALTGGHDQSDPIGMLAEAIAADAYPEFADGTRFSFKVDGVVIHPDTLASQVALRDDNVVELVEVTDHQWADDTPSETVDLREMGELAPGAAELIGAIAVPNGMNVDETQDWVGDDADRAAAVRRNELADGGLKRSTLLAWIEDHFDLDAHDQT